MKVQAQLFSCSALLATWHQRLSLPQPELVQIYLLKLNHRHSKESDTVPLRERKGTSPDGGAVFEMGDACSTCELVLGRNQGLKLGQAAEVL